MSRFLGFVPSLTRGGAQPKREEAVPSDNASHAPATSGITLLPRPIASMVSLMTQSTSLSLRVGTFFGGVALEASRATTLTGLELSRGVIEAILTRAGRDVAIRSGGEQGKLEAESLLERSLAALHTTITSASFFAAATFHLSSTTLSSASYMSQALLSTLDALLGSTESSRAIAAIVTLIRREFKNQSLEDGTEKVSAGDLLVGTVGFAMLQRWGRKNTERDIHESGGDEIIWDVVILDNGARADVVGTHQMSMRQSLDDSRENRRSSFISPGADEESFDAVRRPPSMIEPPESLYLSLPTTNQHNISDEDIRSYIMRQLPQGCRASITTNMVTARTITVDVFDDDNAEIAAPPGTMMVEERFHNSDFGNASSPNTPQLPKHTVVFRTAFNRSQSADLRPSSSRNDQADVYEVDAEPHKQIMDHENNRSSSNGDPRWQETNSHRLSEGKPSITKPAGNRHVRYSTGPDQKHDRDNKSHVSGSSDGSKGTFQKGSFSRLAQRVKPAGPGKSDPGKRPQLRSPFERSEEPAQRAKSSVGKPLPQRPSGQPIPDERAAGVSAYSRSRPSSPLANRGIPRSPVQASTLRSVPSPTTRRTNPRDARNPMNDYYTVNERNEEILMAQSDTHSIHSIDGRPGSPEAVRTHVRSSSSMSLTRSEADVTISVNGDKRPNTPMHQRSKTYTPSMYSVATAGSDMSLILAHRSRKSAYDDNETIQELNRSGSVPGIFPQKHLVQNIRRFCRFASGSYGSNALKVMGVPQTARALTYEAPDTQEHNDFSDHIGLPASAILLSSFVDPAGGSNAAGETGTGFPLVHYLFLDHESKAVVLTLRGTWGFEDVLTDMTCDYDDLEWQGKSWKVHKGMHASAKRLLMGGGGRVMITIRAALEEFPEYGVIFCGHSLGGGVAALLATMVSEPSSEETGTAFITASYKSSRRQMLPSGTGETDSRVAHYLPPGRSVHVYAYGPPATMSPFLRRATRGLITTVVNGQDVVPSLSLGILHDMRTVSLAFKSDISDAKSHVRYRVWEGLRNSIINKFYVNEAPMLLHAGDGVGEDAWAWKTLKGLRNEMLAPKLMPPGEVFVVETMRVLQRNAFTTETNNDGYLGKPATRVQLKFIRDAETLFGELRFGSGMFSDHNPARYETSLAALARGVIDD